MCVSAPCVVGQLWKPQNVSRYALVTFGRTHIKMVLKTRRENAHILHIARFRPPFPLRGLFFQERRETRAPFSHVSVTPILLESNVSIRPMGNGVVTTEPHLLFFPPASLFSTATLLTQYGIGWKKKNYSHRYRPAVWQKIR